MLKTILRCSCLISTLIIPVDISTESFTTIFKVVSCNGCNSNTYQRNWRYLIKILVFPGICRFYPSLKYKLSPYGPTYCTTLTKNVFIYARNYLFFFIVMFEFIMWIRQDFPSFSFVSNILYYRLFLSLEVPIHYLVPWFLFCKYAAGIINMSALFL